MSPEQFCLLVVYPRESLADWELQLTAAARNHEGGRACEKIKIQNMVSIEYVSLLHHHKVEKF